MQADALELGAGGADDSLVRLDLDAGVALDSALDVDDTLGVRVGGLGELRQRRDGGGRASAAAGGAAVGAGVADVAGLGDGGALVEDGNGAGLIDGGRGGGGGEAGQGQAEDVGELHGGEDDRICG